MSLKRSIKAKLTTGRFVIPSTPKPEGILYETTNRLKKAKELVRLFADYHTGYHKIKAVRDEDPFWKAAAQKIGRDDVSMDTRNLVLAMLAVRYKVRHL